MPQFAAFAPDAHGAPDRAAVVRQALAGDVVGIMGVAATRGDLPPAYAERVARWVVDPRRLVLVAERRGEVAGWAQAGEHTGPGRYYVTALTVAPTHQRCGLGDRLLATLVAWVWQRSDTLHSVVNARNEASVALHARHGFAEAARAPALAGVTFDGGEGVLLRARRPPGQAP